MNIFCQPFETDRITDPKVAQKRALDYANKVNEQEGNVIFTISECADDYGHYITVWYKSMKKVEV